MAEIPAIADKKLLEGLPAQTTFIGVVVKHSQLTKTPSYKKEVLQTYSTHNLF